jgi:hypothetical protein
MISAIPAEHPRVIMEFIYGQDLRSLTSTSQLRNQNGYLHSLQKAVCSSNIRGTRKGVRMLIPSPLFLAWQYRCMKCVLSKPQTSCEARERHEQSWSKWWLLIHECLTNFCEGEPNPALEYILALISWGVSPSYVATSVIMGIVFAMKVKRYIPWRGQVLDRRKVDVPTMPSGPVLEPTKSH